MRVLRRFPVSDEFISDRKTFCVILDRNENFEISNNGFFISVHVTPEDMEMSEITLRIEWKHLQIPARPASGRNCPLKNRNLGFGRDGTFFQSFRKFENGRWKKNVTSAERTFSERMEPVRGQSVAWRSRYPRKTSKSSAKSPREPHSLREISHSRPGDFWTAGTPGLHRATGNGGPG